MAMQEAEEYLYEVVVETPKRDKILSCTKNSNEKNTGELQKTLSQSESNSTSKSEAITAYDSDIKKRTIFSDDGKIL